jgi:hypothetical protein
MMREERPRKIFALSGHPLHLALSANRLLLDLLEDRLHFLLEPPKRRAEELEVANQSDDQNGQQPQGSKADGQQHGNH